MEINKADADNLHFQSDFHKSSSIEKTTVYPGTATVAESVLNQRKSEFSCTCARQWMNNNPSFVANARCPFYSIKVGKAAVILRKK